MSEIARRIEIGSIAKKGLVMKDHELVMASYNLTAEEQGLVLACIEKAQNMKGQLNVNAVAITMTAKEYSELFSVTMKTAYKVLRKTAEKLYDRSIKMNDEGMLREARWLQEKALYDSGRVKIVFSSVISKHISQIITKKSITRLEQAIVLRNRHAIRLFEIFLLTIDPVTQEGEWIISLDELRTLLELGPSYDRWADLKKRVIEVPLKLINKKTSLKVDWEVESKSGKQIAEIKFTVFESDQLELRL